MSLTRRPRPRRATVLAGVVLGLALSGCGVAGTDFQPGVAVKVGDRSVTSNEVDDLTIAACDAFETQLVDNNQVVPLSFLRTTIAQNLALRDATLEVGQDYGVAPGERYRRQLSDARTAVGDLPADQLRAVEVLQVTSDLVNDVLGQVGATIAADDAPEGSTTAPPGAASDEALQIGTTALQTWLDDHDVEIDPKYGVELTADGIAASDTSVSFAVSDLAVSGSAEQAPPAETMALPASQRCGSYSG